MSFRRRMTAKQRRAQSARASHRRRFVAALRDLDRRGLYDDLVRYDVRDDLIAHARQLGYKGDLLLPPPHCRRWSDARTTRTDAPDTAPRGWQLLDETGKRAVQTIIDALLPTDHPSGRVLSIRKRRGRWITLHARAS